MLLRKTNFEMNMGKGRTVGVKWPQWKPCSFGIWPGASSLLFVASWKICSHFTSIEKLRTSGKASELNWMQNKSALCILFLINKVTQCAPEAGWDDSMLQTSGSRLPAGSGSQDINSSLLLGFFPLPSSGYRRLVYAVVPADHMEM